MKINLFFQFILLIILTVTLGCKDNPIEEDYRNLCTSFPLSAETYPDEEDYTLYKLIMDEYYSDDSLIHISQYTLNYEENPSNAEHIKMLVIDEGVNFDTSVVASYIGSNKNSYYLGAHFSNPAKVISKEEINCLLTDSAPDSYSKYYNKYPESSGIIRFHKGGYDEANEFALVEYHHFYGSLGAYGWLVLFEKDNNGWQIIGRIGLWVS